MCALSPIENSTFGWGPNFILSPSSLVKPGNERLLVVGMELFRKMPHQNIELDKFFLTQVNNTVEISAPRKIIILDGAQNLSGTKSFEQFGSGPNRIL